MLRLFCFHSGPDPGSPQRLTQHAVLLLRKNEAITTFNYRYPVAMHSPTILAGTFMLMAVVATAQNTSSSLAPARSNQSTATATTPKSVKKRSGFFAARNMHAIRTRKGNIKHSARYEFYERVEKAAKEKQRIMRILAKPQYSDPSYFGHKRKPKRRPPSKMRFCDECHIRH
jgi:hypothetical protein